MRKVGALSDARNEAKRLYLEERLPLTEIAARLGSPTSTVRAWKKRDGWDSPLGALHDTALQRGANRKMQRASENNRLIVRTVTANKKITDKEKDFCLHFISSYNAIQSAIKAGYTGNYATIKHTAYEVLCKPAVKEMINTLKEMKRLSILAGIDDVLDMHMRIAFADIGDYLNFGQREVQVMGPFGPLFIKISDAEDAEKIPIMKTVNFIDLNEKSMVDTGLLAEISQGRDGIKIKLQDRQKSLDFLERYFLINPMDQHKIEYENRRLEIDLLKAELSGGSAGQERPDDNFLESLEAKAEEVWSDDDPGED